MTILFTLSGDKSCYFKYPSKMPITAFYTLGELQVVFFYLYSMKDNYGCFLLLLFFILKTTSKCYFNIISIVLSLFVFYYVHA
jgi:hypothetical protein